MNTERRFLDIPYDEHIVPFPNTASVLMQHAREFPNNPALCFSNHSYTYASLLQQCLHAEISTQNDIVLSMNDTENSILLMLILLVQGIPFHLNFSGSTSVSLSDLQFRKTKNDNIVLPFVRLDDKALILNNLYQFSQYNLLVAAQAVGNAFKLFRPGDAVCALPLSSIADITFGILAPLYFGKTIHFDIKNPANAVLEGNAQYAWTKNIKPNISYHENISMRDSSIVCLQSEQFLPVKNVYYLIKSFDQAAGLGPVTDNTGKQIFLLGTDIEKPDTDWVIRGHCMGSSIVSG